MTTSRSTGIGKKVKIVLFIAIIAIVAWQIFALFKSPASDVPPATQPAKSSTAGSPPPGGGSAVTVQAPLVVTQPLLPKPPILSAQEQELLRIQKQNEEKYVSALSQLQMLKIEREIAETNKAIVAAKLDTLNDERKMGANLQPIVSPVTTNLPATTQPTTNAAILSQYSVISISYLQGKWNAVISTQGKLYQVNVGDTLPDSDAKVQAIDKYGITIKFGEETRKISLVPII